MNLPKSRNESICLRKLRDHTETETVKDFQKRNTSNLNSDPDSIFGKRDTEWNVTLRKVAFVGTYLEFLNDVALLGIVRDNGFLSNPVNPISGEKS